MQIIEEGGIEEHPERLDEVYDLVKWSSDMLLDMNYTVVSARWSFVLRPYRIENLNARS